MNFHIPTRALVWCQVAWHDRSILADPKYVILENKLALFNNNCFNEHWGLLTLFPQKSTKSAHYLDNDSKCYKEMIKIRGALQAALLVR